MCMPGSGTPSKLDPVSFTPCFFDFLAFCLFRFSSLLVAVLTFSFQGFSGLSCPKSKENRKKKKQGNPQKARMARGIRVFALLRGCLEGDLPELGSVAVGFRATQARCRALVLCIRPSFHKMHTMFEK